MELNLSMPNLHAIKKINKKQETTSMRERIDVVSCFLFIFFIACRFGILKLSSIGSYWFFLCGLPCFPACQFKISIRSFIRIDKYGVCYIGIALLFYGYWVSTTHQFDA